MDFIVFLPLLLILCSLMIQLLPNFTADLLSPFPAKRELFFPIDSLNIHIVHTPESPRVYRRHNYLRGLCYGKENQVRTGSPGSGRSHGLWT